MAGEFLSNPFVQSIGSAMGLDPLMGAAASGAAASPAPPAPPQAPPMPPMVKPPTRAVETPREFRQHAATANSRGGRGLQPGAPSMAMNLPGTMSPDVLMHPEVQKLLGQYGVSPDQIQDTVDHASPNLFMTNEGFNQRHPVLSRAVEGALGGLAFTHGGNTVGESLSNVAKGMLDRKAARADKYNNQLMMPFQQAQQVAAMQGISVDQAYKKSQADRDEAMVKHYVDMDNVKDKLADIQRQHQEDLANFHNGTQNLMLQGHIQNANFNEDDQAAYQKMIDDAGGDWQKVDSAKLANLISGAMTRKTQDEQLNKQKVAKIGASGRVAAASVASGAKPNSTAATDYRSEFGSAKRDLTQFDKDLSSGMGRDDDGSFITGKSPKAIAKRARLQKRIDDAQEGMRTSEKLSVPGSGFVQPKSNQPKTKTYNVNTGKFD